MKKNRKTKIEGRPKGWIYGAKWGNMPVEARAVSVTVGIAPKDHWCHDKVGDERKAIAVKMPGGPGKPDQVAYIDNEDGWALQVFLKGLAPLPGFKYIPVFFLRDDETAEPFYKAQYNGWKF